jgi:hypothetical protein
MRGVPTSFAAEPLRSVIHNSGAEVPVWPYVLGKVRGYTFEPLSPDEDYDVCYPGPCN